MKKTVANIIKTGRALQSAARKVQTAPKVLNPQVQLARDCASHWATMTGAQKMAFATLAQTMNNFAEVAMPTRTSDFACFLGVSSTLRLQNAPISPDAPLWPPSLDPLPSLTLTSSWSESGTLGLTLHAAATRTGTILCYGTRPINGANPASPGAQYKFLAPLTSLDTTQDVSRQYLSRFRVSGPGCKITLKLVPVTTDGLRGKPTYLSAVVPAAESALPKAA